MQTGTIHVVDASRQDAVEAVRATSGGGVQFSVEAMGAVACDPQAVACLARLDSAALLGAHGRGATLALDWTDVLANGKGVRAVIMGWSNPTSFIPYMIEQWQAGRFPFDKMITVFDFDDFTDAIEAMQSGEVIKPVIRFP